MSVHADDVVNAIRIALAEQNVCPAQTIPRWTPNEQASFPNRDGHFTFDAAGRDCLRGFRITVEAIDFDSIDYDLVAPNVTDEWLQAP